MVSEVFSFTIENKFNTPTAENPTVRVIPVHGKGHGGTIPAHTPAMDFKFKSSDGYVIFKVNCLNHEIDISDYISFASQDKVQLSVTHRGWRFKIQRQPANGSNHKGPTYLEVGCLKDTIN